VEFESSSRQERLSKYIILQLAIPYHTSIHSYVIGAYGCYTCSHVSSELFSWNKDIGNDAEKLQRRLGDDDTNAVVIFVQGLGKVTLVYRRDWSPKFQLHLRVLLYKV
jgi:hypothetical protein